MKRYDAITWILNHVEISDLVIAANGRISREAFMAGHRKGVFYMLMSMGHAAPIGVGLARAMPQRRIVILDGDGNLLMNMGSMATVVEAKPLNFLHVVLDNQAYGTTGGQRCISDTIDLGKIAEATGYSAVLHIEDLEDMSRQWPILTKTEGPAFAHVKVTAEDVPHTPIVDIPPVDIKNNLIRGF